MKVLIEQDIETGKPLFVVQSKSGKRYTGTAPEEAQRKYLLACLYAHKRSLGGDVFDDIVKVHVTTDASREVISLGGLSITELSELKKVFDDANRYKNSIEQGAVSTEQKITGSQKSCIIRISKYKIGDRWGTDWFWRSLQSWVGKSSLEDLTKDEADAVIKRLIGIEKRISFDSAQDDGAK